MGENQRFLPFFCAETLDLPLPDGDFTIRQRQIHHCLMAKMTEIP